MILVERYGIEFEIDEEDIDAIKSTLDHFTISERTRWVELREAIVAMYQDLDSILKKYGQKDFQKTVLNNEQLVARLVDVLTMEIVLNEINAYDA